MTNIFTWTPLELAANFFTVICIVLAGRNNIHTWWTGLVGCVLFGVMFYNVQLYADATLQVFFFVTGVLGWWGWSKNRKIGGSVNELAINYAGTPWMVASIRVAISVALAYGWLLHTYTNAYAPWIDSSVLAFSVVAQLLLMSRSIQTWQVWVLVNTLSVPLFWSRELYLTSMLYSAFWVNAVWSYFNWKSLMNKSAECGNPTTVDIIENNGQGAAMNTKFATLLERINATYSNGRRRQPYSELCAKHAAIISELEPLLVPVTSKNPTVGSHVLAVEDLTPIGKGVFIGEFYYTEFGFCANRTDEDPYGYITKWCYIDE